MGPILLLRPLTWEVKIEIISQSVRSQHISEFFTGQVRVYEIDFLLVNKRLQNILVWLCVHGIMQSTMNML